MKKLEMALLTVDEIAIATRRSRAAVRASLRRGDLPGVKLGRRWFVRQRDIDAVFEEAVVSNRRGRTP